MVAVVVQQLASSTGGIWRRPASLRFVDVVCACVRLFVRLARGPPCGGWRVRLCVCMCVCVSFVVLYTLCCCHDNHLIFLNLFGSDKRQCEALGLASCRRLGHCYRYRSLAKDKIKTPGQTRPQISVSVALSVSLGLKPRAVSPVAGQSRAKPGPGETSLDKTSRPLLQAESHVKPKC